MVRIPVAQLIKVVNNNGSQNVGNKCEFRDWDNENCGSLLHYMWRAYERFFRALHPIFCQKLLPEFTIHCPSYRMFYFCKSTNSYTRRLWAVLIMHYSKLFCIFRTICERYRYIAIVSYQIFVDCILVYYLKMEFRYHTKGYHLVLHRHCSKLILRFSLEGLGTTLVQCDLAPKFSFPAPQTLRPTPTRTWKWKDTIPYWVYPNQYGTYCILAYSPIL